MSDDEWDVFSWTEKTGFGERTISGRVRKQKTVKKTVYEKVIEILDKHESRCLDNKNDKREVAIAITRFIKDI